MISRKENGKLRFNSLDFEILIGDLYAECKTDEEVNWLEQQLQPIVENLAEERMDEID